MTASLREFCENEEGDGEEEEGEGEEGIREELYNLFETFFLLCGVIGDYCWSRCFLFTIFLGRSF
jgi:hypothetical protein